MNHFKLRIKDVDMDGYNGRDHHPEKTDVGLVVVPLLMSGHWCDPEAGTGDYHPLTDGGMCANVLEALDQENHEICWTCVVPDDGRTLELMEHEVEIAWPTDLTKELALKFVQEVAGWDTAGLSKDDQSLRRKAVKILETV